MQASESTAWLLVQAGAVAATLFVFWLFVTKDLGDAALYAAVLAAVEVALGFGFRAWRKRRPAVVSDPWDAPYDE